MVSSPSNRNIARMASEYLLFEDLDARMANPNVDYHLAHPKPSHYIPKYTLPEN